MKNQTKNQRTHEISVASRIIELAETSCGLDSDQSIHKGPVTAKNLCYIQPIEEDTMPKKPIDKNRIMGFQVSDKPEMRKTFTWNNASKVEVVHDELAFTKERADFIRADVADWVRENQPGLEVTDIDAFLDSVEPFKL